jgi:hypothetical protein
MSLPLATTVGAASVSIPVGVARFHFEIIAFDSPDHGGKILSGNMGFTDRER